MRLLVAILGALLIGLGSLLASLDSNPTLAAGNPSVYVRPDGSDPICAGTHDAPVGTYTGINQPCAVQTIQRGVTIVDTGGVVNVKPGTYPGNVTIRRDVSLVGYGNARLQGSGAGSGFNIRGGAVSIRGFHISGFRNGISLPSNSNAHVTASFNTITDNSYGVYQRGKKSTIDARNNWWGCNEGPGGPCNPVSPVPDGVKVNVSPWLVFGLSAASATLEAGQTALVTADLTHNSSPGNPVATGGVVPDGTLVQFSSSLGSVSPATATTTNGTATTSFTAGIVGGNASIAGRVDEETRLVLIEINGSPRVEHRVTLLPDMDSRTGTPGETVSYRLFVVNNGFQADTYSLTYRPSTWTPVGPDTVAVGAGSYAEVIVTVAIPVGASAGDSSVLTATAVSQGEPGVSDSAQLTTTVAQVTSFWVSVSPSVASQSGLPGSTVSYTLSVNNDGTTQDTYDASLIGWNWLSSGPAVIGPVAAGDSVDVTVTVQIPSDKAPGDQDQVTFLVISRGDPTNKSASASLLTSVPLPTTFRTYLPIVARP